MYKVQVDYTYNIEGGSSITSSIYYLADVNNEQDAITSVQSYINSNNTSRNILHEGKKYSLPTNTGIAVNAVIEQNG